MDGFSYDTSGNLTANGPGTSYSFNSENFMATAGTSISYNMDTAGRRTKKTVSGVTTNYFYRGAQVISELQGSTWTDYVFFGNQRIAKQTGTTSATATYLHPDHLGSTRRCSDSTGNSNGSCDYEPFGEFQPGSSCSALPTNYGFAGMEFDVETALYHTIFRQYDPNQGRWMSADPAPGNSNAPQSLDRYAYVFDDPADFVDPLGLFKSCPPGSGPNITNSDGTTSCGPPLLEIGLRFVDIPGGCHLLYIDGMLVSNSCGPSPDAPSRDRDRGNTSGPSPSRTPAQVKQEHDACVAAAKSRKSAAMVDSVTEIVTGGVLFVATGYAFGTATIAVGEEVAEDFAANRLGSALFRMPELTRTGAMTLAATGGGIGLMAHGSYKRLNALNQYDRDLAACNLQSGYQYVTLPRWWE